MADKLKEAIGVLKKVRHWIDYGAGELEPTANAVIEAIDTVVANYEKNKTEFLKGISTQNYGEDGVGLSKEDLDECLYK